MVVAFSAGIAAMLVVVMSLREWRGADPRPGEVVAAPRALSVRGNTDAAAVLDLRGSAGLSAKRRTAVLTAARQGCARLDVTRLALWGVSYRGRSGSSVCRGDSTGAGSGAEGVRPPAAFLASRRRPDATRRDSAP